MEKERGKKGREKEGEGKESRVPITGRTRDRKVAGSIPGQGAIKSTRSTQPSIPPG